LAHLTAPSAALRASANSGQGLNWVCFFGMRNHLFFCNPLWQISFRSFWHFGNWPIPFDYTQGKLNALRTRFGLGLNWVCFDQVSNCVYFHKYFCNKTLGSSAIRLRRTRLGLFCIKRVDLSRILDRCRGPLADHRQQTTDTRQQTKDER